MRKILALLLILLLPGLLLAQTMPPASSRPLVLAHVTMIDVTGAPPKSDMTVVVEGNRIMAVGKSGKVRVPRDAQVIDASGKFLIPGLWDMHAHSVNEQTTREIFFPLEIANGITGVRDMFADCSPPCLHKGTAEDNITLEEVNEWRRRFADGTITAPRIVASSPIVDGVKSWDGVLIVKNAAEAREAVRYIKRRGNDFIKVYSFLSREAYFAIADEAKKQNLVFAGHIPDSVSAVEASDAGQKSDEHLTGILLASSTDEAHLRSELLALYEGKSKMSLREIERQLLATYSDAKASALFARFTLNGTWMCPTLVERRIPSLLDDKNYTSDVRLKYLPPSIREDWKHFNFYGYKNMTAQDFAFKRMQFQKYVQIVGALHRAGVKTLAGSDMTMPYCFPGFSLHDELGLLVQAGLTPLEALQTATINPAKYLGREKDLGTIEKGKLADLVLLDANPLAEISNTKKINTVVLNGRLLGRDALDKMLADVEASAKNK